MIVQGMVKTTRMKKEEIKAIFEEAAQYLPERTSGNEAGRILMPRMAVYVQTERSVVVELLRDWIALRIPQAQRKPDDGKREFWMWFALDVVEEYRLVELKRDVEGLIADIHDKKAFLPYYEDSVWKHYNALRNK